MPYLVPASAPSGAARSRPLSPFHSSPQRCAAVPRALVVALVLGGVGGLGLGGARPAQAQQGAVRPAAAGMQAFQIAPGPLAPALRSLASQANVLLSFTAAQTEGKATAGLQGRYTAAQALQRLLQDTGLEVVELSNGGYVLRSVAPGDVSATPAAPMQTATLVPRASAPVVRPAQEASLPAVVVKGDMRSRSLQETASSVTVLGVQALADRAGAATVADAVVDVPNVLYTSTVSAPIIRGQDTQGPNFGSTAFFGGTIPRATINLDGHYLGYYEYVFGATSIWDVDSVEVFRGPQTTAQGANAIAGAIVVHTKDPSLQREAAYQLEAGSQARKRASVMLSGPLVGNELAARLAVDYWSRDTFITYTNPRFAQGNTDQDFRSLSLRGKLLWAPSHLPGLTAKLTYAHTDHNRPTWETASAPFEDLNNATASMPSWKQNADTGVLDVEYDFDNGMRLLNQTRFADAHVERRTEPANNGTAVVNQRTWSNDLRMSWGAVQSTLSGVLGLYVAQVKSDDTLFIRGTSLFDDQKQALGVYSEATYRFADRWALTGGLRYQRDHIRRQGTSPYAKAALAYGQTFDALLPKVSLAYEWAPDATVGALVSKGYNPGGVNLSVAQAKYVTFDAESVWNYEIFSRARLLDKRLTLSANLFFSDFRDSQRLLPDYLNGVQYGAVAVNADRAKSRGLELGMDYLVRSGLHLKAGVGLLHTRIGTFTAPGGAAYVGKEFGSAPGHMLSLGVDWNITPAMRLAADVRRTDRYHSSDENTAAYAIGAYTVANARVTYSVRKGLEVYGFVNNLLDERAATYRYADRSVGGIVANVLEPRTIGFGIKGTF